MSKEVISKEVEVRAWPERADLVVIDYKRALPLAQYPVGDPVGKGRAAYDPWASWEERCREALAGLE